MKAWKRFLSLFMVVLMLTSMMPVNALAVDETEHIHEEEGHVHEGDGGEVPPEDPGVPVVLADEDIHIHDYVAGTPVAATCSADGYTPYTCSCGETELRDVVAATGEHEYIEGETVAATCVADGYTIYACACGASEQRNVVPAVGHSYVGTVIAPTETAQGYTEYVCSTCGDSYRDEYTQATGTAAETSTAYQQVQFEIDRILTTYVGSADVTAEHALAAVAAMDMDTVWNALIETEDLNYSDAASMLSEKEFELLVGNNATYLVFLDALSNVDTGISTFADVSSGVVAIDSNGGAIEITANVGSFTVSGTTVNYANAVSGIQLSYKYTFKIYNRSAFKGTLSRCP